MAIADELRQAYAQAYHKHASLIKQEADLQRLRSELTEKIQQAQNELDRAQAAILSEAQKLQ